MTRSKKEPKTTTKKEKDEQTAIKSDPGAVPQATAAAGTTKIKNEAGLVKKEVIPNDFRFTTPADMSPLATTLPDTSTQLHFARLLTPCSDNTELFAPTHGGSGAFISVASPIPANDAMFHHHHHNTAARGFEYTTAAANGRQESASSWHPTSPSYSPFQLPPYELDNFNSAAAASGYCDHISQQQHHHHHQSDGFGIAPSAMMEPDHTHTPVKHEEWDSGLH